jgi:hypothetical protein
MNAAKRFIGLAEDMIEEGVDPDAVLDALAESTASLATVLGRQEAVGEMTFNERRQSG